MAFNRVSNGNVVDQADINQILDVLTAQPAQADQKINIANVPPGPGRYISKAFLGYHNQTVAPVSWPGAVLVELDQVRTAPGNVDATTDPSGMFNAAGHYFTIPQSGFYSLMARGSFYTNGVASIGVFQTGSGLTNANVSRGAWPSGINASRWLGVQLIDLLHFNVGDQLTLQVDWLETPSLLYTGGGGAGAGTQYEGETWMSVALLATTSTTPYF